MGPRREAYNPLLKSYPDSEKVNAVSIGAETLFTRLVAASDDAGRYFGEPGMVLGKLYTRRMCAGQVDLETITRWINEVVAQDLVQRYEAGGKRYLQIVNPRRALRSDVLPEIRFPDPPVEKTLIVTGKIVTGHDSSDDFGNPSTNETVHVDSGGTDLVTSDDVALDGAPNKPTEVSEHPQITSIDVAAYVASEMSDTESTRRRSSRRGTIPIGRTQPNPTQPNPENTMSDSGESDGVGQDGQDSANGAGNPVRGASELPAGFVEFWREYPKCFRKQGRSKCLAYWRKHKLESLTSQVVAALRQCKASPDWKKERGQFVPLPFTWLNRTPWESDLADLAAEGSAPDRDSPGFERVTVTDEHIRIAYGGGQEGKR